LRRILAYNAYKYDKKRYLKFSDSYLLKQKNEILGNIIKHYHVIEKGLTMPETRLGFGQAVLFKLSNECDIYFSKFGSEDTQFKHALDVLQEYKIFHEINNYELPYEVLAAINHTLNNTTSSKTSSQKNITTDEYFAHNNSSFELFSSSRSSIRNFSNEDIPIEKIYNALDLSRNCPSACNRQSWRVHIYTEKEQILKILDVQGGNRGFGHLTNKLIVITGELGVYGHSFERNQVFIDGGMFAMNVLYSLHFHKIGACILNCSTTPQKDLELQNLCKTNKSEVFIAMVACGIPPKTFKSASSPRYELGKIATFH
jgi:nitroreductase